MNFHQTLSNWRARLFDPSKSASEERERIADTAALVKIVAGFSECIFVPMCFLGMGLAAHYPLTGACMIGTSCFLGAVALESYLISRNVEVLMSNSMFSGGTTPIAAHTMVTRIFKDTILTGPLCSNTFIRKLEKKES